MSHWAGKTHTLLAGTAAITLAMASATAAQAAGAPGQATTIQVDINGGDLGRALAQLGRSAGVQIAFLPDRVRGRKVKSLHGAFTIEDALDKLLAGTGLSYQKTTGGSYIVGGPSANAIDRARDRIDDAAASQGRDADGKPAIPDILVTGRRNWTLDLDIPRTQDDAQPYVVFSHEQIERSGSTSLEDFFKNFLNANTSASTSTQTKDGANGQSLINLRGLGPLNTLILIDGRRSAQANVGIGALVQSSINGIPMDAIERIEVLPSSASGIYGSNAVGGVINIILRKNFKGIEANAYYGNATRLDAFENRLSLNGSFPLEGGKTRVSFTGSWRKSGTLYEGDRDYSAKGRAALYANIPNYLSTLQNPLFGATPNIRGAQGALLVLKPAYGGTALGSAFTYAPAGFRGIGLDGVAALVANAGKQNPDLSPTIVLSTGGNGLYSPLLRPTQTYNASLTVKRDFSKWLSVYVEGDWSRYESITSYNPNTQPYTLPSSSPYNPFTTGIVVADPIYAGTVQSSTPSTTKRLIAGTIVKLPLDWQAVADFTWSWSGYKIGTIPAPYDQATVNGIKAGSFDLLRDPMLSAPAFTFANRPASGLLSTSKTVAHSYTLKLAGPLPLVRLWGGKPFVTLLLEQDKQSQGQYVSFSDTAAGSTIRYNPARWQRSDSAYGEISLPIIGERNHVPLVRAFEFQVAGRYDRYVGTGADTNFTCLDSTTFLPDSAFDAQCPQPGVKPPVSATTRNHSFNPTLALKWTVVKDLAFRGSYSTGYLPPPLNNLVSTADTSGQAFPSFLLVSVKDPLRGNEAIGTPLFPGTGLLPAVTGGNTKVDPQTSKSWSFGAIVTPSFVPGLRLSVDWSLIVQKNVYYSPVTIFTSSAATAQLLFNDFVATHPERFVRDTNPATFGTYGVGPITAADVTTANESYARSAALDFSASYDHALGRGQISIQASATHILSNIAQTTPSSPIVDSTGVDSALFLIGLAGAGGAAWKGSGSAIYATDRWSLGARVRYNGPYWLTFDRSIDLANGSNKIKGQALFDIFGSFNLTSKTIFKAGVNDVFDTPPRLNADIPTFYSLSADPRRANFYVNITRRF